MPSKLRKPKRLNPTPNPGLRNEFLSIKKLPVDERWQMPLDCLLGEFEAPSPRVWSCEFSRSGLWVFGVQGWWTFRLSNCRGLAAAMVDGKPDNAAHYRCLPQSDSLQSTDSVSSFGPHAHGLLEDPKANPKAKNTISFQIPNPPS